MKNKHYIWSGVSMKMWNHHFQFLSLSKNDLDGIVQEFCTENIACCLHSFIKKAKKRYILMLSRVDCVWLCEDLPELTPQFAEMTSDSKETERVRRAQHTRSVIMQVTPQPTCEGLKHTSICVTCCYRKGMYSTLSVRAARLIECDCHAHFISKVGSEISSKSPSRTFKWSSIYYTEP